MALVRSSPALAVAAGGLALALAACGGGEEQELPPEVAAGERVFQAQGCGSCHTLGAAGTSGTIGPNLDDALDGRDRQFIKTSIVDPEAFVEEGFPSGVMPGNYEQRLEPMELEQLVEFLFETAARD